MICTEQGFLADVYLDDFYSAEYPSLVTSAFSHLSQLFHQLGLDSGHDKDSPPSTSMICLGILVDTVAFTREVPATRLTDLQAELTTWQAASFFIKKQLQSLLGKLSFVTRVLNPVEFLCLDYSTVSVSAHGQLVTVILFPLLCSWTFSGGLLFFRSFIVFLLLSLPSGISRASIFPPMPVFMVAVPLVARSALTLFFLISFRPLLFISTPWNFSRLLLLSSTRCFSCQEANSLSHAIILLQSRSSILPPPRTLSVNNPMWSG